MFLSVFKCPVLRIHFITHANVQCEIRRHLPLVLHKSGGEGTRIVVDGVSEALLIELGQAK